MRATAWLALALVVAATALPARGAWAQDYPPLPEPVPQVHPTEQARLDAEADIDAELETTAWFAAGCLLGVTGVLLAWLIEPEPPPSRMVGKPAEYWMEYSRTYRKQGATAQAQTALVGCVSLTGVYALVMASVFASGGMQ